MSKYQCAVVEVSRGKFEVANLGDVLSYKDPQGFVTSFLMMNGKPYVNPLSGIESRTGKYAGTPHIRVNGGDNAESVEEFKGQVARAVEDCTRGIENRVPELIGDVAVNLKQKGYDILEGLTPLKNNEDPRAVIRDYNLKKNFKTN